MYQDDAVMATNNDASTCKKCAVQVGYWKDPYIGYFVTSSERKAPEINRGYYARVEGMKLVLDKFLQSTNNNCQIVNLGAGYDTLYWRLKDEGVAVQSYVEVDFSGVTSRKCYYIRNRKPLLNALAIEGGEIQYSKCDLHAGPYHLVAADMRNITEVENKLLQQNILDVSLPTIFLAECVLVYMDSEQSKELLSWIASHFQNTLFVNYEQVNMMDRFGEIMMENLRKRNCELLGVSHCQNLETQTERFLAVGWDNAASWDMMQVYSYLPIDDVARIEKLEFLDEKELLQQLLQHYCITIAYKGGQEVGLENIGFP